MQDDNKVTHDKFLRTPAIYDLSCPFDNQYQGVSTRLLFVCSAGLLRSPTAANTATRLGYNSRSCGSASYALIPTSVNLVHWANRIYFMEENNFLEATETFYGDRETLALLERKAIVWEIEDHYDFGDPWLTGRITELLT